VRERQPSLLRVVRTYRGDAHLAVGLTSGALTVKSLGVCIGVGLDDRRRQNGMREAFGVAHKARCTVDQA